MTLRLLLLLLLVPVAAAQRAPRPDPPKGPTTTYFLDELDLQLEDATGKVVSLKARSNGFDFAPGDWYGLRADSGFYHLGDLTLRVRAGDGGLSTWSSARSLKQPEALDAPLAASDMSALFEGSGLRVIRRWENRDGDLALVFELTNTTSEPVMLEGLGIPMVFGNILHRRSLEEAHAVASFHDAYIGQDAGYVQVVRLDGTGPVLTVTPLDGTPLEAWRPLLDDRTPRNTTHEGFYAWTAHSQAWASGEWNGAEPWNPPTARLVGPQETVTYGVQLSLAPSVREVETHLRSLGMPVAVGLPGYVLPLGDTHLLHVDADADVQRTTVHPPNRLILTQEAPGQWRVESRSWGRARVTVDYADGRRQTVHYKVIKGAAEVVADMGRFYFNEQWFDDERDPFGRAPSVISYDYTNRRQVTEDNRAWIAGLGDEGGSGSWLGAAMKQLIQPDPSEVAKLERFVDETLWGGLQYADGPLQYGVRKSLFWYDPEGMPDGTYSDSIGYGGWSSWSKEHAATVERSYNYPHVAALYWTMYRLARTTEGLVTNHDWVWYLERAHETAEAMVRLAPHYAQFGQMEGTVFLRILEDLQREVWTERAAQLEATMRTRADLWASLDFPFGSEMAWDSTGQEEVYAWSRYFGFEDKALVTLNAILAYMPAIAHWGYNGSARRYWDFWYAGHPATSRLERQLHHYGSALNALPVLRAYRDDPEDWHLLRIGYAGMMGALANVTQDGFAPAAFHAYPQTLANDGYSGDYGPGFLGHVLNVSSFLIHHPHYGWQGFGGQVSREGGTVTLRPTDSARMRAFVAPANAWIELDAGRLQAVQYNPDSIVLELDPASETVPRAYLRIEGAWAPAESLPMERGAGVIDLTQQTSVTLLPR
jgi:hypothetical protein